MQLLLVSFLLNNDVLNEWIQHIDSSSPELFVPEDNSSESENADNVKHFI